ncbi:hypothetical protein V6N12_026940 [Hibiscus sabdariffa]|uniref:Uncharacterized protein n=1 Tax=Hibiscus sabdariffa TaxID=183260 RepID=A0ABR2DUY3_9ROSI
MEALPKQHQGVVVVIDIDDGGEEEQANQTDNVEGREDSRRCSASCSNEAKSETTEIIKERGSSVSPLEVDLEAETKLHLANVERDCRICHLSLDPTGPNEMEMTEQWNDSNDPTSASAPAAPVAIRGSESRNFWQGHRFLNFLLACMVFAFVISWLFHFNIPS